MTTLRISAICLVVALLTGGVALLADPYSLGLPEGWNHILRIVCITGLVGFAVSFMVGLDRRSLVKS